MLALAASCAAQTGITVHESALFDLANHPLSNGRACLQATTSSGVPISFRAAVGPGAGGQIINAPYCTAVTNGAWSISNIPDTALTSPVNVCLKLTVKDLSTNQYVVGPGTTAQPSGYQCLQPTQNNSWCISGVCDVDNFLPNLAPLVTETVGIGVPMGGTTNQILRKLSGVNYDTGWEDPSIGVGVPEGGATNQALVKNSGTNYDDKWFTLVPGGGNWGQALVKNSSTDYDETWFTLIPGGGSTGQALVKNTNTDWDSSWVTLHNVPSGGSTGQALVKNSGTDYDAVWLTLHNVPPGGSTGQFLKKNSGTDYDASWATEFTVPAGGYINQILSKNSNSDGDTHWVDPHNAPAGGTAGQALVKIDGSDYNYGWGEPNDGVPSGGTAAQILAKIDSNNYNTQWINLPQSGLVYHWDTIVHSSVNNWSDVYSAPIVPVTFTQIVISESNTALHCTILPRAGVHRLSDGADLISPVTLPSGLSQSSPLILTTFVNSTMNAGDQVQVAVTTPGAGCNITVQGASVYWESSGYASASMLPAGPDVLGAFYADNCSSVGQNYYLQGHDSSGNPICNVPPGNGGVSLSTNNEWTGTNTFDQSVTVADDVTKPTVEGFKRTSTPGLDSGYDYGTYLGSDNQLHCLLSAALGSGECNSKLLPSNNLNDLLNTGTARTNLGLGSAATHASTDFDAAGAAAARALPGTCTSGLYVTSTTTTGNACAQVQYSQIGSPPSSLPPSGTAAGDLRGSYPNPTIGQVHQAVMTVTVTQSPYTVQSTDSFYRL